MLGLGTKISRRDQQLHSFRQAARGRARRLHTLEGFLPLVDDIVPDEGLRQRRVILKRPEPSKVAGACVSTQSVPSRPIRDGQGEVGEGRTDRASADSSWTDASRSCWRSDLIVV
eukprot:scaffold1532_cov141-Pinguiococcus_pyrenoidosus.AAC.2